ncbi:hypothetical protein [Aporhodopirellula aestuarii]|uniref:IgA-specific metalloendopeptidase n=1 Tax=Aporhodopirellula aestuarii TaxID=2950107 RepID=A0ABT0UEA3_9BACT|nr:hypothetical protein [Aporhodopirellula aestuarii]MCM2375054.1 hypothetical protein [Aporhodopirellula aestuarii]
MSGLGYSKSDSGGMLLTEPPRSTGVPEPPARSEMLPQTQTAIIRFANRRARLQLCRGVAIGVITLVAGMLLLVAVDHLFRLTTSARILLTVGMDVAAVLAAWFGGIRQSRHRDWAAIARGMESATPRLRERLLSAVELEDPRVANGSVEFRSKLQSGVAAELSAVDVRMMLPWGLVRRSLLTAVGAVLVVTLLCAIPSLQLPRRLARAFVPIAPIERASITKIAIVSPTPPTRGVAEGDLVAVMVEIGRLRGGDVELQWRSDDGRGGRQRMAPRDRLDRSSSNLNATADPLRQQNGSVESSDVAVGKTRETGAAEIFAANVQVDTTPVHYRVLAGDGETLWHTLTPMPRPRVVSYEKRYQFPSYAKLPDVVTLEEHGDLKALVGTRAEVTVVFDQPVRMAEIAFGDGATDARVPMRKVDGDPTRFLFPVAIKTPGSYRVDAISLQSELNNPFLPRNAIDPIVDQSPIAAWSPSLPIRQITSSAAVLKLTGRIEDDLPMDRYVLQYIRDDGPVRERLTSIDPPVNESEVEIVWDMMDLDGTGTHANALPSGTLLKARLVALDRAGHRGESEWLHVYIGGDNFDPHRHDRLFELQSFTERVNQWWNDVEEWGERVGEASRAAKETEGSPIDPPSDVYSTELARLQSRWLELAGGFDANALRRANLLSQQQGEDSEGRPPLTLDQMMSQSNDSMAVDRMSLMDRIVMNTLADFEASITRWGLAAEMGERVPRRKREVVLRDVMESVRRGEGVAKQIGGLFSELLAVELAAATLHDLNAVRADVDMLASEDSSIPIERLPGQAELLAERVQELETLIDRLEDELPKVAVQHLRNLRRFLNESTNRMMEAKENLTSSRNPDVKSLFHEAMERLRDDMSQHHVGSLIHGNTYNAIAGAVREMGRNEQHIHSAIKPFVAAGGNLIEAGERVRREKDKGDTNEIDASAATEMLSRREYDDRREELIRRFERAESSEQVRTDSLVKVAADFRLVGRVIEHVTQEGFVPYEGEPAEDLFERIGRAATVLESGGMTMRMVRQLQDMVDRERHGRNAADLAIRQGIRLEHFQVFSETPLQQLRDLHPDAPLFDELRSTRWNEDYAQARELILRRRYSGEEFVSASAPVQAMVNVFRRAMPSIEGSMEEARATLRAMLPTTGELAQAAADEAKAQPESPRLDQLQEKVDRVAENLVDRANEADLTEAKERELARDADAALRKIQEQMEAVAAPIRQAPDSETPPDVTEQLDQLAETLERTAAHFDAAEAGEDVSETREALREGLDQDMASDAIDDARRDAEAKNKFAETSPEELLRRLEEQLRRDPPMQEALADISDKSVADIEQAVRSAAEQERRLQGELEKSDPEFIEEKRMRRGQLRSFAAQASAVNDQWLAAAETASHRLNDIDARDSIREMRQRLQEATAAAEQVQHDEALMEEIRSASQQLRSTLAETAHEASELQRNSKRQSAERIVEDDKQRKQLAKDAENLQRRTQNEWVKSLDRHAQEWRQRRDEAGRRIQQNQNQQRDAQNRLRQAENQLAANPDQQWAQQNVRESRERVDDATKAVDAAKQSREAAAEAMDEAERLTNAAKKQSVKAMEAENPIAELLSRASEISDREMVRLSEGLQQLEEESIPSDEPSPSSASAKTLARQQDQARQAVAQAAGDLQRAARHEERLGNSEAATGLRSAADQLDEIAQSSMEEALESLERTSAREATSEEGPAPKQPARSQLGEAAAMLAEQAEAIASLAGVMSSAADDSAGEDSGGSSTNSASQDSPSGTPTNEGTLAETDRSEKLARTLDEIDRELYGRPMSSSSTGESGDRKSSQGAAEQGDAGSESESGQAGEPSEGQPSSAASAGQASPTLSRTAEQATRNLAESRQQRLSQIASAGQPNPSPSGQPGEESGDSADPGAESGKPGEQKGTPGTHSGDSMNIPEGGYLSIDEQNRVNGDWGNLRQRKSNDVIQDRKTAVPLTYRPAIEAYFQAIAAEAARRESSSSDAEGGQ